MIRATSNLMLAFTEPAEGCDADFNAWYDEIHVPELLATPGIMAVQRFRFHAHPEYSRSRTRYMAIYELDTDDFAGFQAMLRKRAEGFTSFDRFASPPKISFYRGI